MSNLIAAIGHCPKCKKFMSSLTGVFNGDDSLIRAEGVCKAHGKQDIDIGCCISCEWLGGWWEAWNGGIK